MLWLRVWALESAVRPPTTRASYLTFPTEPRKNQISNLAPQLNVVDRPQNPGLAPATSGLLEADEHFLS